MDGRPSRDGLPISEEMHMLVRWSVAVGLVLLLSVACGGSAAEDEVAASAATVTVPQATATVPQATATVTQATATVAPATGTGVWQPPPGATWQWQLTGETIDTSFDVAMYDLDLFDADPELVRSLHDQGRAVVCYLSAGSVEDWRPDAGDFPASVVGKAYEGWEGERWLDIRQIELLAPIMGQRLDSCKSKGFDAVEPDNIDAYTNDTGFPLTYEDQLNYNIWLAGEAHARGLSIGLKNTSEQAEELVTHFDWALTEGCFVQGWCQDMVLFVDAGKAVFAAEYTDVGADLDEICPEAGGYASASS